MTCVLIRRGEDAERHTDMQEEAACRQVHTGVMLSQAKEGQEPPEAGRAKAASPQSLGGHVAPSVKLLLVSRAVR